MFSTFLVPVRAPLLVQAPAVMKADIDSAFRRVPVRPDHRWAAAVAWQYRGEAWISTHIGMPFGAAASGIAWHKVGHLLLMIGRILLGLPLLRYVDDYFAVDRCFALLRISHRHQRIWSGLRR